MPTMNEPVKVTARSRAPRANSTTIRSPRIWPIRTMLSPATSQPPSERADVKRKVLPPGGERRAASRPRIVGQRRRSHGQGGDLSTVVHPPDEGRGIVEVPVAVAARSDDEWHRCAGRCLFDLAHEAGVDLAVEPVHDLQIDEEGHHHGHDGHHSRRPESDPCGVGPLSARSLHRSAILYPVPANGLDSGVGIGELGPEAAHVDVDRVGTHGVSLVTPHLGGDRATGHDRRGPTEEQLEEPRLDGRERHLPVPRSW